MKPFHQRCDLFTRSDILMWRKKEIFRSAIGPGDVPMFVVRLLCTLIEPMTITKR